MEGYVSTSKRVVSDEGFIFEVSSKRRKSMGHLSDVIDACDSKPLLQRTAVSSSHYTVKESITQCDDALACHTDNCGLTLHMPCSEDHVAFR